MNKKYNNIYFFIYSYLPGISAGGPIISISRMINALSNKCLVITLNRDVCTKKTYKKSSYLKNTTRKKYIYKSPGITSFICFIRMIFKMKYNSVIYMSSFFRISHTLLPILIVKFYRIFGFKRKIKLVISPRNEFALETLKFSYWKKSFYIFLFKIFLNRNIYYHATTRYEYNDIRNILGIKSKYIYIVQNIDPVQLPLINLLEIEKRVEETKLFFAGRIARDKYIHLINEILLPMKESKNIFVDLWGPIRDKRYLDSLLEFAARNEINLNYKGTFIHEEKEQIYQSYHGFLFPAMAENYAHVIADSLSFSLPVIISNNTPWKSKNDFKSSGLIAIDNKNLEEYRKVIRYIHSLNKEEFYFLRKKTFITYKELINKSSQKKIKEIFENN